MATIYEDVETLKTQMAQVLIDIDNLTNGMPDANDLLARATTDLSDENLNEWVGEIYVGYGNGCTNKPAGAGNLRRSSICSRQMVPNSLHIFDRLRRKNKWQYQL